MARTTLLLLVAGIAVPALAGGAAPATKNVFGKDMTEAEFNEAEKQLEGALALAAGFAALGADEVPWTEPPTYDLGASPLVSGEVKPGAALPMRVKRTDARAVELQIDARALPTEEMDEARISALDLSSGVQHFKLSQVKIASFDRGPDWRVQVELPASIGDDAPVDVRLGVTLGLPGKLRVEPFAPGQPAPQIPGLKLLATRPTVVVFEVDDTQAAHGIFLFGEAPDGRRIDRTGRDEDDGRMELLRKALVHKTFAELPAKLEFPPNHVVRVKQTYASPPARYQVVVPLDYREQQLVLTGNSAVTPLLHDPERQAKRICQPAELSRHEVFAHRSTALMGLGDPHFTLIVPDCVNFAEADFKLVQLKAWNKAGQPIAMKGSDGEGPQPLEVSESGYGRKRSGNTWYLEGEASASVGKVEGELAVDVAELEQVAFDRKSIARDASGRWKIHVTMPEGAEVEGKPVLLDEQGLPLDLSSSSRTSMGDDVTVDTAADLSSVAKVIFFVSKAGQEKRHVTIPFTLDFARIPAPPRKS